MVSNPSSTFSAEAQPNVNAEFEKAMEGLSRQRLKV